MTVLNEIAKSQLYSLLKSDNVQCENVSMCAQDGKITVTATFACNEPKEQERKLFEPEVIPF